MSKSNEMLLQLEQIHQEYFFDYNCLDPVHKKKFMVWIGTYLGYSMERQQDYALIHNKYWAIISRFYQQRYNLTEEYSDELLMDLFDIDANKIPNNFKTLTYHNSCILKSKEYYFKNYKFAKEFDKYWTFLTVQIKLISDYDISNIDNIIFKNAFLEVNNCKSNSTLLSLDNYYQNIMNNKLLLSKNYKVNTNELNNSTFVNLLAQTLASCDLFKFEHNTREQTRNCVINLYNIFDSNSLKSEKMVS